MKSYTLLVKPGISLHKCVRMDRIGRIKFQMICCDAFSNKNSINQKTEIIIGTSFEVMNELGSGFLESVYHQSFVIALRQKGLGVHSEVPIAVSFRGHNVGNFKADLIIDKEIIVEIKAVDSIIGIHKAQVINYLVASGLAIGLVINFGNPKVEVARMSNPQYFKK